MKLLFFLVFICCAVVPLNVVHASEHDRVVVPLILSEPIPGGHGSLWSYELHVHNSGSEDVLLQYWMSDFGGRPEGLMIRAGETMSATAALSAEATRREVKTPSLTLDFPRVHRGLLTFNLRIFDLSRQLSTWGTEIPVIGLDDFRSTAFFLLPVPIQERFRLTLRIYRDLAGPAVSNGVTLRAFDIASGELLLTRDLEVPRRSEMMFTPGYLEINDLAAALPELQGSSAARFEIVPSHSAQRVWAFVSVTNNDTQHVTTITP